MSSSSIRLHVKLYRARAIDAAIEELAGAQPDASFERRRNGEHHVVTVSGLEGTAAAELLAEVADAALVLTAEADQR